MSNTKEKKPKIQWVVALGAAGAWFGQQAGAGFASDLQTITYFTGAGYLSLFTTLVPMVILGIMFYFMGEYAREIKAQSYKDVALTLYSNNEKVGRIMLLFFDLIIMGSVLITSSTTIAGAATLMQRTMGVNYLLASILFTGLIVLVSMFGARVLAMISLPLMILLVGMLATISGLLIFENMDGIKNIIATKDTFGTPVSTAVQNMFYYTGLQTGFCGAYIAIAGGFGRKEDNKVMAISGTIINGGMLAFVSLAVLSRMPGIKEDAIPILTMVTERFGENSILGMFYTWSLYLAYVSTADVVAATSRFGVLINKSHKHNQILVDTILACVLLTGSLILAQLGIKTLVNHGYKTLSLMRGPIYIAGGLIFAPIRLRQIRRARAQKQAEGAVGAAPVQTGEA